MVAVPKVSRRLGAGESDGRTTASDYLSGSSGEPGRRPRILRTEPTASAVLSRLAPLSLVFLQSEEQWAGPPGSGDGTSYVGKALVGLAVVFKSAL